MKTVGQQVQEARDEEGLSQQELAERIGLDRSMVSKIENDRVFITPEVYTALITALRVLRPADLIESLGYRLNPPAAARLPRELIADLLALTPENMAAVMKAARGLRRDQDDRDAQQ